MKFLKGVDAIKRKFISVSGNLKKLLDNQFIIPSFTLDYYIHEHI
jgi:hypothetical protein